MGFNVKGLFKQGTRYGKHVLHWASANSNWLLAMFASLGVLLTAEEAIRATVKAVKICEEKQIKDGKEVVKTVWRLYIPMAGFFLLTTLSIGGNAHINAKRLGTALSLVALKDADLSAWKEKAKEMLGEKKVDKIEDEVERDVIEKDLPIDESKIIKTGHGHDLFKERLTGQYIEACPEWITAVEEKINTAQSEDLDGVVTAGYYLDELGADSDCYIAETYWDKSDMRDNGYKRIKLDVTDCKWVEINGAKRMVSTIRPVPYPNQA